MRYSLANYILSVEPQSSDIKSMFGTISLGGEGSYLGTISLSLNEDLWTTTGYATGGWVHNKSLDKHGTASVTLNQLSDPVSKFIQLCNIYYTGNYPGFTLSLSDIDGNKIATCIDCYITKIPDQVYANSASDQTWSFTCGQINYN